jgi:tRNA (adenine22-N1)-methyltransferase
MTKYTILPDRLRCLLNEVSYTDRLIDVGSDHGYSAAFALENKKAGYVIATDIHLSPARRTKEYLASQGLSEMSEVHCTDGLTNIALKSGDTILIAGMGGLEIIRILVGALALHNGSFPDGIRFVLQPQRSFEELREFLSQNGFPIEKEVICVDRNRLYVGIITTYTGKPYFPSLCELVIGLDLIRSKPDGYFIYLTQKKDSLIKQSAGRKDLAEVIHFIDQELIKQQKEK